MVQGSTRHKWWEKNIECICIPYYSKCIFLWLPPPPNPPQPNPAMSGVVITYMEGVVQKFTDSLNIFICTNLMLFLSRILLDKVSDLVYFSHPPGLNFCPTSMQKSFVLGFGFYLISTRLWLFLGQTQFCYWEGRFITCYKRGQGVNKVFLSNFGFS